MTHALAARVTRGNNRIYKAKQWFEDGGAFYNLSAAQGMVVAENHFFDFGLRVAIYLDEGSR